VDEFSQVIYGMSFSKLPQFNLSAFDWIGNELTNGFPILGYSDRMALFKSLYRLQGEGALLDLVGFYRAHRLIPDCYRNKLILSVSSGKNNGIEALSSRRGEQFASKLFTSLTSWLPLTNLLLF
jgi:hypothetical protein